jgi:hypothetical protein
MTTPGEQDDAMTRRWGRLRLALAGVLVATLTGCGGPSDAPSDGATSSVPRSSTSSTSATYPFDTSADGDDLLAADVRRSDFGGAAPVSWRFPTFYAGGESDETSTFVKRGDVLFTLLVQAGAGTTPRATAEKLAARIGKDADPVQDVRLGGRDWLAVVGESDAGSRVTLFGSLPGGIVVGATFTASVPLADVPPERIDELQQTALSIRPSSG